jgi:hypothetical protein
MPDKKEDTVEVGMPVADPAEVPEAAVQAPRTAVAAPSRKNTWIAPVLITLAVVFALAIGSSVAFGAARLVFGAGRGFGPGAMMGQSFDGYGGQGYGRGGMMGRGWQNGRGDIGPGTDADGLCPYCGRGDGAGVQPGQPNQRGRMGPGRRGWQGVPPQSQESTGASQSSNGTF